MKKIIAIVVSTMFLTTNAFALFDPTANVNTNTAGAVAGAVAGSSSISASNSSSNAGALSLQGQGQSVTSDTSNSVSVGGDTNKNKTFAYGHSSVSSAVGTEAMSIGSVLGGISWSDDNHITKLEKRLSVLEHIGHLTEEDIEELAKDIRIASRMPRFLGLFKSSGRRSLINLFGLLLF